MISISDISLPAGRPGCETNDQRYQSATQRPSWKEITAQGKRFTVIFDMLTDLKGIFNDKATFDIHKSMSRIVQYRYQYMTWLNNYSKTKCVKIITKICISRKEAKYQSSLIPN